MVIGKEPSIYFKITELFRLMDFEKMHEKLTFLLYFSMIYPKFNFIFWRNV